MSDLPYVERFRPTTLDQIISHDKIINTLTKFIEKNNMPHLLFYGPPGTGKTSTINAVINQLYGIENVPFMTMTINASDERGIEIIRNKIKPFISSQSLCNTKDNKIPNYKFVILDEADAITQSAQKMLKQIIEKYTGNARFCLICNCIKSINTALQSRCVMYNFSPLELSSVNNKILTISKDLNINITKDGIEKIWKLSNGDMRKVLHMFQVISIGNKHIDSKLVSSFKKYPYENDIEELYKIFMKNNLKFSLNYLETFIKDNNYYLSDIISEITLLIIKNIIDKKIKNMKAIKLIKNIRECENNIITTTDTTIQIFSFVSIFSL